ncbi:MAG: hypothetical protein ACYC3L_01235 [Gemmatimonadaceae bacterium]
MRLRDDTLNKTTAAGQRDTCDVCRDYLAFATDGMGRVTCYCPHCRDGRPHSRARWLARLEYEDRICRETPHVEQRECAWCDAPYTPENVGQRYCQPECREAAGNHRANVKNAERRRLRAAGKPLPLRLQCADRPLACLFCGQPIVQRSVGKVRQYCNFRCRNRSYRTTRRPAPTPADGTVLAESPTASALRRRWDRKQLSA